MYILLKKLNPRNSVWVPFYRYFFKANENKIIFKVNFFIAVINGEKATFNTPTFAKKRERTLDMLIKDLYSDYMSDSSKVVSFQIIIIIL